MLSSRWTRGRRRENEPYFLMPFKRLHNLPEKDSKKFKAINGKTTGCIERVLQAGVQIQF